MTRHLRIAPLLFTLGCAGARPLPATAAPAPATADAAPTTSTAADITVLHAADVTWEALNPARGDASPRAGTLWGDRKGAAPTGFLVRFVDGFSSPPHIHNVTYRGVVIQGLVHNDDPQAQPMWMPAGSFWTQPVGEAHITAASGDDNIAFIEIDSGPYLVRPLDQAFDSGERPVNLHAANVVWIDASAFDGAAGSQAALAPLWGTPFDAGPGGAFLRLPAGTSATVHSHDAGLRAVVVQGEASVEGSDGAALLAPGSLFSRATEGAVAVTCPGEAACVVYVRGNGSLGVGL